MVMASTGPVGLMVLANVAFLHDTLPDDNVPICKTFSSDSTAVILTGYLVDSNFVNAEAETAATALSATTAAATRHTMLMRFTLSLLCWHDDRAPRRSP